MCHRGAACRLIRLCIAKPKAISIAMARIQTAHRGPAAALARLPALRRRELCNEEPNRGPLPRVRDRAAVGRVAIQPTRGST
jgi:hypothetical protein